MTTKTVPMDKAKAYRYAENHSWESEIPEDVKAKWLAALRSGSYTQAHKALRERTECGWNHCCLSVLAEEFPGKWKRKHGGFLIQDEDKFNIEEDILPPNEWLTFEDMTFLANMNDGSGPFFEFQFEEMIVEQYVFTFSEIADFIERKL